MEVSEYLGKTASKIRDLNYSHLFFIVWMFSLCKDERTDFMYHKNFL